MVVPVRHTVLQVSRVIDVAPSRMLTGVGESQKLIAIALPVPRSRPPAGSRTLGPLGSTGRSMRRSCLSERCHPVLDAQRITDDVGGWWISKGSCVSWRTRG